MSDLRNTRRVEWTGALATVLQWTLQADRPRQLVWRKQPNTRGRTCHVTGRTG